MTKKEIAILSFKILGVYAVIQAIEQLPDIINYFSVNSFDSISPINFLLIVFPLILIVMCSTFLWFGAPLLASLIFKSSQSENLNEITLADIQVTAFSIVGLFIIASTLSDITEGQFIQYWVASDANFSKAVISVTRGYIFLFLIKLIIGLWLLFGANGIVNLIRSVRRD